MRILRAGSRGVPKARTPREFKQNRSSRIRSTRWSVQAVYYPLYYLVSLTLSLSDRGNTLRPTFLSFSPRIPLSKNSSSNRETAQTRDRSEDGTKSREEEEEEGARLASPSIERHACNTTREISIYLSTYT